jgi:hypothetical protein
MNFVNGVAYVSGALLRRFLDLVTSGMKLGQKLEERNGLIRPEGCKCHETYNGGQVRYHVPTFINVVPIQRLSIEVLLYGQLNRDGSAGSSCLDVLPENTSTIPQKDLESMNTSFKLGIAHVHLTSPRIPFM